MKSLIRISLLMTFMLTALHNINGQSLNKSRNIYISVNLLKIFMGMPNLELEYSVSSGVSIFVFNEVNLFGKRLRQKGHPDYVFRSGGRYHFLKTTDTRNDLHCGPYIGYARLKSSGHNQLFLGADVGYRYRFSDSFFVFPRTMITYFPGSKKVTPGLECLLGGVIN